MLQAAFWLLSIAVAAGVVIGLRHLRPGGAAGPRWRLGGLAHGIVGTAGLAALIIVLRGPLRGAAMGVTGFGPAAAWTIALAAGLGLVILMLRRGGQAFAAVVPVHALMAITGYVVFLAWWALG